VVLENLPVSVSIASLSVQQSVAPGLRLPPNAAQTWELGTQQKDDTIVQAEVLNITSRYEGPWIYSYVTLSVTKVVTGQAILNGTRIVLRELGGEVNGTLLWLSDQPYFFVGERVEISVRQQGNVYVPASQKRTLAGPLTLAASAGYVLEWYNPTTNSWVDSTSNPGPNWYGPLKWTDGTLDYWINPQDIPPDLSDSSFVFYATAAFQTWQDDPNSAITFSYRGTRTDMSAGSQDGTNVVGWGNLGGSTIGLTYAWAQFTPGNFDSLRFTETDIIFDNSKPWSAQPSGVADKFDVQDIGTHEAGHTFGLGDLYLSADSEETMYGIAEYAEIKKRTLEYGDRAGVASLYPRYAVTFYADPISGTVDADGVTMANGDNETYDSGTRVHLVANSSVGYSFASWEASGVSVDSSSSNDTYMTVLADGWLRAHFSPQVSMVSSVVFPAPAGSEYFIGHTNPYDNQALLGVWAKAASSQGIGPWTQGGWVDQATGRPLVSGNLVLVAGPLANKVVSYYQSQGLSAGFRWANVNGVSYAQVIHRGQVLAQMRESDIGSGKDIFVVQTIRDGDGRFVLMLWGIGAQGTLASGVWFVSNFSALGSLTDSIYIYSWTDTNGDKFPEPGEITLAYQGN
jgi:hypothetical protein